MDLEKFDLVFVPSSAKEENATSFSEALELLNNRWFTPASRRARWLDIVGDYAGTEPFVLDGDALCQNILSDNLLALGRTNDPSFQVLHALHALEWHISRFLHCKVNFDVIFFDVNRHLTIPIGQANFLTASMTLARVALFRQLRMISQNKDSTFEVHCFSGLNDPGWLDYESRKRPMFIMTNDGNRPENASDNNVSSTLLQRIFIREVLSRNVAVGLLDGADYRGSKILSFIFEDRNVTNMPGSISAQVEKARQLLDTSVPPSQLTTRIAPPDLISKKNDLLAALGRLCILDTQPEDIPLLYLALLQCSIFEDLAIRELAQPPFTTLSISTNNRLLSFLAKVFSAGAKALAKADSHFIFPFDGTLFVNTLWFTIRHSETPLPTLFGAAAVAATDAIWESISSQPSPPDLTSLASQFPDLLSHSPLLGSNSVQHRTLAPFVSSVFGLHPEAQDIPAVRSTRKVSKPEDEVPSDWEDEDEDEDENREEIAKSNATTFTGSTSPSVLGSGNTIFSDDRHWHNSKSLLPSQLGGPDRNAGASRLPVDVRHRNRVLRRTQRLMTQVQRQAASLTGAQGAVLTRIAIPKVGSLKQPKSKTTSTKMPPKVTKKTKQSQLSSKEKLLIEIASKKESEKFKSQESWWNGRLQELQGMHDHKQRSDYLLKLSRNTKSLDGYVGKEFILYTIHSTFASWIDSRNPASSTVKEDYIVAIFRKLKDLISRAPLTSTIARLVVVSLQTLGFTKYAEGLELSSDLESDRPLGFQFVDLMSPKTNQPIHAYMRIEEEPISWQLRAFGPYMDRSMDGKSDPRVNFVPDAWQRKVLDSIDRNESLLVVAPTSAGKTFISFYAMEKVLRSSDTGVIVYVCPTKALVMQVAADIYARFSKDLDGGIFWAVHTRDYRINDPLKCQILITVPEMLSIMLLSPALSRLWSNRLERIILDEIHTIGQQEGGAVWEQILLLAPCPIIGLSATIGSPDLFNEWLNSVQKTNGFRHTFIEHPHRYSHLRKFVYALNIKERNPFSGLSNHIATKRDRFLHPVTTLAFGTRSLPADFTLEAADTLSLYHAMKSSGALKQESVNLDPITFFADQQSKLLTQADVITYEGALKQEIEKMLQVDDTRDPTSDLSRTIAALTDPALNSKDLKSAPSREKFRNNLIHLVCDLHTQNELPAIIFNFDRTNCDIIVQTLTGELERAEETWKSTSEEWKQKMAEWEEWKRHSKARERNAQAAKRHKNTDEEVHEAPTWHSSFQPHHPSPDFTFASAGSSIIELEEAIDSLAWTSVPEWQKKALRRGIAVHHAGTNKAYRTMVETFFRTGTIRVIVATGTLALGINAPTKTCVFAGDSPFLTALMYRQCSGRAGRRGFDLLGKVVFYGLPVDRVQRLVLSKLPSLSASFPLTATLTLRLFNLLENSDHSPFAVKSITSILSLSHISFGSTMAEQQLRHHLRFSIEYLRRSGLIDERGRPMNLFGLCGHLYYEEPSNFALIALMRSGIIHKICANPIFEDAKKDLILVLSHLFGRKYLLPSYTTQRNLEQLRKLQPSRVVLPPLPQEIQSTLKHHSHEILKIYSAYATQYATQYASTLETDDILPLSRLRFAGSPYKSEFRDQLRKTAIQTSARSLFVATSGHDDHFGSVHELATTLRHGFEIEAHAIPSLDEIAGTATHYPLNAYILDFFTHGQVSPLVVANGIRRGDMWYLLQHFALVMMTISSTMRQLFERAAAQSRSGNDDNTTETVVGETDDDMETMVEDITEEDELDVAVDSYQRPVGVSDTDWRVYEVLSAATAEFEAKFRKIWA